MTENESESIYSPEYSSRKPVKVISVDGAYIKLGTDECRLLFYTVIPYLKWDSTNESAIEEMEKLQVEIRLSTHSLQKVVASIIEELTDLLHEHEEASMNTKIDEFQSVEVM